LQMPLEGTQQRACGDIPQPDRCVAAARQHARAVGRKCD
jgi:hypothetical protein